MCCARTLLVEATLRFEAIAELANAVRLYARPKAFGPST